MKPILALLLIFTCITGYSQKNFSPGYIIENSGDTIKGVIKNPGWSINPKSIVFHTNGEDKTVDVNNLKAFEITGKDHYTKAIITKSTRPVNYAALLKYFIDTTVTDTVFLKQLVKGNWNLYELADYKKRYYLQVGNGPIEELRYIVAHDERTLNYRIRNIYRDQINLELIKINLDLSFKKKLEKLEYKERDLTPLFENVNKVMAGQKNIQASTKQKLTRFYAGTGLVMNGLKASGEPGDNFRYIDFSRSFKPSFQAGVNFIGAGNLQKLILRFDFSYANYSISGKGSVARDVLVKQKELNYELSMNNFTPSVNLMYVVFRIPAVDVFIGAGAGYVFSNYKKNRMEITYDDFSDNRVSDPYLDFESGWMAMNLRAGVKFQEKWESGITYRAVGSFSSYQRTKVSPKMLNLQVNYIL
jgi:hypothetical protein